MFSPQPKGRRIKMTAVAEAAVEGPPSCRRCGFHVHVGEDGYCSDGCRADDAAVEPEQEEPVTCRWCGKYVKVGKDVCCGDDEDVYCDEDCRAGLAAEEKRALQEQEAIIARGLETFVEVGRALAAIRDECLYPHSTFEAYCAERWGFTRSYAYRLINAAKVVAAVSPIGDKPCLLKTESQARAISPLVRRNPAEAAAVLEDLGPDATADEIADRVAALLPRPKSRPKPERRPTPGDGDTCRIPARFRDRFTESVLTPIGSKLVEDGIAALLEYIASDAKRWRSWAKQHQSKSEAA